VRKNKRRNAGILRCAQDDGVRQATATATAKTNTGVLRCAQDDDVRQATATALALALQLQLQLQLQIQGSFDSVIRKGVNHLAQDDDVALFWEMLTKKGRALIRLLVFCDVEEAE
jgi:hypothetical protein